MHVYHNLIDKSRSNIYQIILFSFCSMIAGTVIFQALMIGVFTLKKVFLIVGLIAPLPFITFGIWKFIDSRYGKVGQFLSLREGRSMRSADSQFLQVCLLSFLHSQEPLSSKVFCGTLQFHAARKSNLA